MVHAETSQAMPKDSVGEESLRQSSQGGESTVEMSGMRQKQHR